MKHTQRGWLFVIFLIALFASSRSSAMELLARLPDGTKIMLDNDALRAVANGGTRWLLTAKQAGLDENGNQPAFAATAWFFHRSAN